MKKYLLIILIIVATVFAAVFLLYPSTANPSHKNAAYLIDGKMVTLKNGLSETEAAPGSAEKITTQYFGNEVRLDLNADERADVAFLITQSAGGTGTFYYVVAALNMPDGYHGSHGLLLGDRIAPQTTEINTEAGKKNIIIVNYADRAPGEPFSALPSVGKSIWLKLDPETMQFGEIEQNFEGEADPARMSLRMKTWTWADSPAFTLTFNADGRVAIGTDCNSMGGNYTTNGSRISFYDMVSTLMYCEGSKEGEFASLLQNSQSYHFTSKGELILELKSNGGSVTFR